MTRSFMILIFGLLALSFTASGQKKPVLTAPGAGVVKLAGGFSFTEGPAVDRLGNVCFTDQPNNKIHIWTINGKLETFLENSGRANGLYFDPAGNLLSCSDMDNELWSIAPDKTHSVLVLDYNGKKLNGPNDLWILPGGGIYFTDPLYVRPYWTRDPAMQQDGEHVYYLSPDYKTLVRVATDLIKPNGIVGTPDGKTLYVADFGGNKTYAYDIQSDGSLTNKRLFADLGSDGMTIDNKGNVYLTGDGVTVFNRKGKKIMHIPVDAPWTANVCFGGKEMKTLFITASDGLFAIEMKVKGVSK
ncbi:MAG: SMP-30/gluconolactonase/LRE family protein [Lentimicrobium sp.]